MASACNPFVSGSPVSVRSIECLDAMLSESIPVKSALADGFTHFLVLRSRPEGTLRKRTSFIEKFLARRMFGNSSIVNCVDNKLEAYKTELSLISSLGDRSRSIYPSEGFPVGQMTKDRKELLDAAIDGFSSVLRTFEEDWEYIGNSLDSY